VFPSASGRPRCGCAEQRFRGGSRARHRPGPAGAFSRWRLGAGPGRSVECLPDVTVRAFWWMVVLVESSPRSLTPHRSHERPAHPLGSSPCGSSRDPPTADTHVRSLVASRMGVGGGAPPAHTDGSHTRRMLLAFQTPWSPPRRDTRNKKPPMRMSTVWIITDTPPQW
jgi:hypothetical protein